MIKVKATKAAKVYNKALKELHYIPEEGEVFEVTPERYDYLHGNNRFNVNFVERCEPEQTSTQQNTKVATEVKTVIPEIKEEPEIYIIEPGKEPVLVDENLKPVKKTRKKSTTSEEKPVKKSTKKTTAKNTSK